MSEKLPTNNLEDPKKKKDDHRGVVLFLIFMFCLVMFNRDKNGCGDGGDLRLEKASTCAQVDPLLPSKNADALDLFGQTIAADNFKGRAVEWLAGAVRVPTESFDQMGPVGTDPRWDVFVPFHQYLATAFPAVHATLALTKINTHGLIYVWQGTDITLKPLLLAGHQDVVPVAPTTVSKWKFPPFSGHFDGERIWGRGSSDDKSGLIGILSSIELLIGQNFTPTRTVVLAFGFDEEISGLNGAKYIAAALLESYGKDAFALVVDEGGGFSETYGGVFAVPAVAEKGYIDVKVEVTSPGGHSSVPPKHTSIGMLASLLVEYESNPHNLTLSRKSPVYATLQCLAAHAPDIPSDFRKTIKRSAKSDRNLKKLSDALLSDKFLKSLVQTTQAVDVIQGGVKSNALPEQAWAIVNHRISTDSSLSVIKKYNIELLKPLASKFNLSLIAFGETISDGPAFGTLTLTDAFNHGLEPAPITPTSGKDAAAYELLSGVIKATYAAHRASKGALSKPITVSPGIMSGNTDTRYYWDLSPNIFRYNHHDGGKSGDTLSGIHTVNESLAVNSFLEMIRFFGTLILNVDESTKV